MNSEEKKLLNDYKVLKMRKRLELYDSDSEKDRRIAENICKYCNYIGSDNVVFDAFTKNHCKHCGEEMIFANSNVDKYCLGCAKKLNVCRHCGSEMD